jgi:hypothetical protein
MGILADLAGVLVGPVFLAPWHVLGVTITIVGPPAINTEGTPLIVDGIADAVALLGNTEAFQGPVVGILASLALIFVIDVFVAAWNILGSTNAVEGIVATFTSLARFQQTLRIVAFFVVDRVASLTAIVAVEELQALVARLEVSGGSLAIVDLFDAVIVAVLIVVFQAFLANLQVLLVHLTPRDVVGFAFGVRDLDVLRLADVTVSGVAIGVDAWLHGHGFAGQVILLRIGDLVLGTSLASRLFVVVLQTIRDVQLALTVTLVGVPQAALVAPVFVVLVVGAALHILLLALQAEDGVVPLLAAGTVLGKPVGVLAELNVDAFAPAVGAEEQLLALPAPVGVRDVKQAVDLEVLGAAAVPRPKAGVALGTPKVVIPLAAVVELVADAIDFLIAGGANFASLVVGGWHVAAFQLNLATTVLGQVAFYALDAVVLVFSVVGAELQVLGFAVTVFCQVHFFSTSPALVLQTAAFFAAFPGCDLVTSSTLQGIVERDTPLADMGALPDLTEGVTVDTHVVPDHQAVFATFALVDVVSVGVTVGDVLLGALAVLLEEAFVAGDAGVLEWVRFLAVLDGVGNGTRDEIIAGGDWNLLDQLAGGPDLLHVHPAFVAVGVVLQAPGDVLEVAPPRFHVGVWRALPA